MTRLLTILMFICFTVAGYALAKAEPMPEPPVEYIWDWVLEEFPMRVTVYYDLDKDGRPDLVYLHEYLVDKINYCQPPARTATEIILPFDCESSPLNYRLQMPATTYWMPGNKPIHIIEKTWGSE